MTFWVLIERLNKKRINLEIIDKKINKILYLDSTKFTKALPFLKTSLKALRILLEASI